MTSDADQLATSCVDEVVDVAASAASEWSNLVTAAVLGTDRHALPRPQPGWESLTATDDLAVELLNRAAAVATARRAGARPSEPRAGVAPAPADPRPMCSAPAANILATLLGGEHSVLLPEWFARCEAGGFRPPAHLVPVLLLRGRRQPAFDVVVRRVIGPLAPWLAEAMPELGVKPAAGKVPPGDEFAPPPQSPESGAVVAAIIDTFVDRTATWATVPQLRLAVAGLDDAWLPALVLELNRAPFNAVTERSRVDLLGLATIRRSMIEALAPPREG
jgi:hypothetical protein